MSLTTTAKLSLSGDAVQRYSYPKLHGRRDIRLLRLFAEAGTERLRGEFGVVSLEELSHPYAACSYCWGDPTPKDKIRISDKEYLNVTSSAASILRWILDEVSKGEGWIWIDSLCIDQENDEEKGCQVGLMSEIYSKCQGVFAWIGDYTEENIIALEFLHTLGGELDKIRLDNDAILSEAIKDIPSFQFPSKGWTALANFLKLPYFQRIWVIQEIVMGPVICVICGGVPFDWNHLALTLQCLMEAGCSPHLATYEDGKPAVAPPGYRNIRYINGLRISREQRSLMSLVEALIYCHRFHATEPKDKIYAVLGLANSSTLTDLKPNYRESTAKVYISWTRELLLQGASLLLHASGGVFPRQLAELPSWVPDWSVIPKREAFGFARRGGYCASGASTFVIRENSKRNAITIQGRLVDKVKDVLPSVPTILYHKETNKIEKGARALCRWLRVTHKAIKSQNRYPSRGTYDNAYWRTMIANLTETGDAAGSDFYECFECFAMLQNLRAQLSSYNGKLPGYLTEQKSRSGERFILAIGAVIGTHMFTTEGGYLGLGQPGLNKGDEVYIVSGTITPFIFRNCEQANGETFGKIVIGDCYVHGMMDGEGLSMAPLQDIELF